MEQGTLGVDLGSRSVVPVLSGRCSQWEMKQLPAQLITFKTRDLSENGQLLRTPLVPYEAYNKADPSSKPEPVSRAYLWLCSHQQGTCYIAVLCAKGRFPFDVCQGSRAYLSIPETQKLLCIIHLSEYESLPS